MPKYTEGICGDGAAILKDGEMITIEQVLKDLNEATQTPQPLGSTGLAGYADPDLIDAIKGGLWWIDGGLSNADLNARETRQTLRYKTRLEKFLTDIDVKVYNLDTIELQYVSNKEFAA